MMGSGIAPENHLLPPMMGAGMALEHSWPTGDWTISPTLEASYLVSEDQNGEQSVAPSEDASQSDAHRLMAADLDLEAEEAEVVPQQTPTSALSMVEEMLAECDEESQNEPQVVTEETWETWARRASARLHQIAIAKARPEYRHYARTVPMEERRPGMPQTPDPYEQISKSAFDRQLLLWRRQLHEFEPDGSGNVRFDGQELSPGTDATHITSEPLSFSHSEADDAPHTDQQQRNLPKEEEATQMVRQPRPMLCGSSFIFTCKNQAQLIEWAKTRTLRASASALEAMLRTITSPAIWLYVFAREEQKLFAWFHREGPPRMNINEEKQVEFAEVPVIPGGPLQAMYGETFETCALSAWQSEQLLTKLVKRSGRRGKFSANDRQTAEVNKAWRIQEDPEDCIVPSASHHRPRLRPVSCHTPWRSVSRTQVGHRSGSATRMSSRSKSWRRSTGLVQHLAVDSIRWAHDSINVRFSSHALLVDLLLEMLCDQIQPEALEPIDVVKDVGNSKLYALDGNRRLWVLKELQRLTKETVHVPARIKHGITSESRAVARRFTSRNDGARIKFRLSAYGEEQYNSMLEALSALCLKNGTKSREAENADEYSKLCQLCSQEDNTHQASLVTWSDENASSAEEEEEEGCSCPDVASVAWNGQKMDDRQLELKVQAFPLGYKDASVTEVNVSENRLTSNSMPAFVSFCKRFRNLQVVKLHKNEIGQAAIHPLKELIRSAGKLRELHLSHNCLSERSVYNLVSEAVLSRRSKTIPLWLRVEQNKVTDPKHLLQTLRDIFGYHVCPRYRACTLTSCCQWASVHLPFLDCSQLDFRALRSTQERRKQKEARRKTATPADRTHGVLQ